MGTLYTLNRARVDEATGVITIRDDINDYTLAMRREGKYVGMSASFGPLEIALRLSFGDLIRVVKHLKANNGLFTTLQVGTGNSFLGLGLHSDGSLRLRPTLVSDATGYVCLNFALVPDASAILQRWLDSEDAKSKPAS